MSQLGDQPKYSCCRATRQLLNPSLLSQEAADDPAAYSATAAALAAVLPLLKGAGSPSASSAFASSAARSLAPLPRACSSEQALRALHHALVCPPPPHMTSCALQEDPQSPTAGALRQSVEMPETFASLTVDKKRYAYQSGFGSCQWMQHSLLGFRSPLVSHNDSC